MSQEIEIEFKNLLTKQEFTLLKNYFNLTDALFIKQDNHYFDTPTFSLKEQGCALRIRKKNGTYELTLKEPLGENLLETNQILTPSEAEKIIASGQLLAGPVKDQLLKRAIPMTELQFFGTLTTKRAEVDYKGGVLVLDDSSYSNQVDFELEYEVTNRTSGEIIFTELLQQLNITPRKTKNKVQRFYQAKYGQNDSLGE